jgi:antitoxin MazE
MIHSILGRWGKNLAVRLPPEIAGGMRLREGDRVEIVSGPDEIVIRRARPRFTREELFAGKSPNEWRTVYATACEWPAPAARDLTED